MRAVLAIARRDIAAFFVSPMAYVLLTVWLLYQGFELELFTEHLSQSYLGPRDPTLTPLRFYFGGSGNPLFYVPLFVLVPVITMRLFAEERRSGTLEALLTTPVSDRAVVAGKYLAALGVWAALWAPTVLYPWILSAYGDVDVGVVAASYVGVLGIGVYYVAIGVLMSAVSSSQVVAAVLTFFMVGLLFLLGIGEHVFQAHSSALAYVSVLGHMEEFSKGVVDTRFLVFDVTLAALALFLAVRVLEGRRYQG